MSTMIAIEIRPEKMILVEGQAGKGSVTISRVAIAPLPKGAITESEITEVTPVMDTLQRLIKDNGIKTKNAVITLDIGNMLLREFELPAAKNDELAGMVKTEMTQNYASASSDIVQFKKIGEITSEEGKRVRIRALSISSHIVEDYHNVLKNLKLKPVAMDANSNALEKLIHQSATVNGKSIKEGTSLILEFGIQGSVLHAIHNGELQLSRFTALGLEDLNEYISSKINQFGERGFYLDKIDFNQQEESDIKTHASAFMMQWCGEIQKVIKFILLRMDNSAIHQIFITGEGTTIPGMEGILKDDLGSPVEIIQSVSSLNFKREEDKNLLPLCINAAGALIRL